MADSTLNSLTAKTAGQAALLYGAVSPYAAGDDRKVAMSAAGAVLLEAADAAAQRRPLLLLAERAETDSTTLVIDDANKLVSINKSTAANWIIPPNADVPFDVGTQIAGASKGAGVVTIVAGSGVTIQGNGLVAGAQYASWAIVKLATDTWLLSGTGPAPVADGTYTVGLGVSTDGTITIVNGVITAIQEATP